MTLFSPLAANRSVALRDARNGKPEHNAVVMGVPPPLLDVRGRGRGDGHTTHGVRCGAVLVFDPGINLAWGYTG